MRKSKKRKIYAKVIPKRCITVGEMSHWHTMVGRHNKVYAHLSPQDGDCSYRIKSLSPHSHSRSSLQPQLWPCMLSKFRVDKSRRQSFIGTSILWVTVPPRGLIA